MRLGVPGGGNIVVDQQGGIAVFHQQVQRPLHGVLLDRQQPGIQFGVQLRRPLRQMRRQAVGIQRQMQLVARLVQQPGQQVAAEVTFRHQTDTRTPGGRFW